MSRSFRNHSNMLIFFFICLWSVKYQVNIQSYTVWCKTWQAQNEDSVDSLWPFNVEHVLISLSCLIFMFLLLDLTRVPSFTSLHSCVWQTLLSKAIHIKDVHVISSCLGFEPMTLWLRAAVFGAGGGGCCDQGFISAAGFLLQTRLRVNLISAPSRSALVCEDTMRIWDSWQRLCF